MVSAIRRTVDGVMPTRITARLKPDTTDYLATADKASSITCAGVHPRARSSRMPVSPSDLLNFWSGDFMISG